MGGGGGGYGMTFLTLTRYLAKIIRYTYELQKQYCSTLHNIALHYDTLHIRYNTLQYNAIQYNTIQYNTIQYIEIVI